MLARAARSNWMIVIASWSVALLSITVYLAAKHFGSLMIAEFILLLLGGICAWQIFEYIVHRYIFHFHASTDFGKVVYQQIHGLHHEDPDNNMTLVMPLLVSCPLGTAFMMLFVSFFGERDGIVLFLGFGSTYLYYEALHCLIHVQPRLAKKWLPRAYRIHLDHHRRPTHNFGVTTSAIDHVAGTFHAVISRATRAGGSHGPSATVQVAQSPPSGST